MGVESLALLGVLNAICDSVDQLAAATAHAFARHPDYQVITSFPGLADASGAVVLGEIGDDRARFADDRALQAFAGSAPITERRANPAASPGAGLRTTVSLPSGTPGRSPPPPENPQAEITPKPRSLPAPP
jgi:hypothetical protein